MRPSSWLSARASSSVQGTLDAVVCGSNVKENVSTLLNNVSVCLEPKGYFVLFSYGSPTERLSYIEESKIDFDVAIKAINKPSLKAALQGGSYDLVIKDFKEGEMYENCHFVYICRKNDA